MKKIITAALVCAAISGVIYGAIKVIKTYRELPEIDFNKSDPLADYNG